MSNSSSSSSSPPPLFDGKLAGDMYTFAVDVVSNPTFIAVILLSSIVYLYIYFNAPANFMSISLVLFVSLFIIIHVVRWIKHPKERKEFIKSLITGTAVGETPVPEIRISPQVFNIPANTYTYTDAQAICSAYGAKLATYENIEDAYKHGAEWCNYGWSDGQMALFPTQKKTFDELQTVKGHEHDCGRPGINGGYIDNPRLRFGVNCFGYKPKITEEEEYIMENVSPVPKTKDELAMEARVQYWKQKLTDIIVSPFNYDTWSKL